MNLPKTLIAVGMKYIKDADVYIRDLELPANIALVAEHNEIATGGTAYAVMHRGKKLAYIREADLGKLKWCISPYGQNSSISAYDIIKVEDNYLVLTLKINTSGAEINPCSEIHYIEKELTMFDKIVATNKTVAVTAAYMEAGRIANNQVAKLVAAKAPLMVKGYVDTPVGKLVLANLTSMAVEQFRPTDAKLKKVSNAMMSAAYQELIQTVNIEGMLNELTSSEGIKNALAAVAGQEDKN